MVKPYSEEVLGDLILREFPEETDQRDLVWHRDRSDREIIVVEGLGWKFQVDNELPFELNIGDSFNVKAYDYHRLIKGNTRLILGIRECG